MNDRASGGGDAVVLETRQLTKVFGGLTAVNGVDLVVRHGEILSLIGPNGAGKTTVFNVVTGIYRPEGGEVFSAGRRSPDKSPIESSREAWPGRFRTSASFRT